MAHQITTREDGIVEAMYANRPGWHGLGEVFDVGGNSAPTSEEAMRLAHLDWSVEKSPCYHTYTREIEREIVGGPQDGGTKTETENVTEEVKGSYVIRRSDTRDVLGVVGERYSPFQNAEAFQFMDSLQQDGIMRYDAAFSLSGGSRVCLLARLPSVDFTGRGTVDGDAATGIGNWRSDDANLRYLLVSTSHDGTSGIDFLPTSMRVECANMLAIALNSGKYRVSMRHTGDLQSKLGQVRKYLSLFDEKFTQHAEGMRILANSGYTKEQAAEYINTIFPAPVLEIPEDASQETTRKLTKAHGRAEKKHDKEILEVREAFNGESNRRLGKTWWRLVNSVTWTADHGETLNNQRGTKREKQERRFLSQIEGPHQELKSRAFDTALEMCKATSAVA